MELHMLDSRSEQGVETDGGATAENAQQVATCMPVRKCVWECVYVWLFVCMYVCQ